MPMWRETGRVDCWMKYRSSKQKSSFWLLCGHCWHCKLSKWLLTVPPMMTKLPNWQSFLLIFYLSTLLSLVALFVVVMTTCGATSDDRVAKLTTFLCLMDDVPFLNVMIYRWCVYREFSATRYGLVEVNIISERIFVKLEITKTHYSGSYFARTCDKYSCSNWVCHLWHERNPAVCWVVCSG